LRPPAGGPADHAALIDGLGYLRRIVGGGLTRWNDLPADFGRRKFGRKLGSAAAGATLAGIWADSGTVSEAVCVVRLVEAGWEQVEQLPKRVSVRYKDFSLQRRLAGKNYGLCRPGAL
jgi:hypothetical protein